MSEIEANWMSDVSGKITGKISDWWNGTYSFESSSSAFMIDGIESEKPNPDTNAIVIAIMIKTTKYFPNSLFNSLGNLFLKGLFICYVLLTIPD